MVVRAPLPKALRPRPMCIDALATKETMREYDFVEGNENIWENRKMSEYKLCVRIRGREYQTSDAKTKLPPDGAKVHIERDRRTDLIRLERCEFWTRKITC